LLKFFLAIKRVVKISEILPLFEGLRGRDKKKISDFNLLFSFFLFFFFSQKFNFRRVFVIFVEFFIFSMKSTLEMFFFNEISSGNVVFQICFNEFSTGNFFRMFCNEISTRNIFQIILQWNQNWPHYGQKFSTLKSDSKMVKTIFTLWRI
jgi:hypothetical protein